MTTTSGRTKEKETTNKYQEERNIKALEGTRKNSIITSEWKRPFINVSHN